MSEKADHTKRLFADYDKAELDLLKEGLNRSYKERFQMTTLLYKIQQTMQKASITYKPFINK
ncbi:MAG: hypothetical protein WBP45_15405 [Daejeonella sp.]